jgi:hypothetical protein
MKLDADSTSVYRPWCDFDFASLPIAPVAQRQFLRALSRVQTYTDNGRPSSQLLCLLHSSACDLERGTMVPISDRVNVRDKNPEQTVVFGSRPILYPREALKPTFFTNPLIAPTNRMQPDAREGSSTAPRDRLANRGFLVVTMENDAQSVREFEESLSWFRSRDGQFEHSQFADVDRQLLQFMDYRGHCIVYSGSRSFHCHFVFSTEHIASAPWDAVAEERQRSDPVLTAALMHNVHDQCWDVVHDTMVTKLQPSIAFDRKMRSAVQWRRLPGAIRILEKDLAFLGLTAGSEVPQLILHENIRVRAPKAAKLHLVPPRLTLSHPAPLLRRRHTTVNLIEDTTEQVRMLQDLCSSEWGEQYPMPVEIGVQEHHIVIRFKNHPDDRTPSTVCIGQQRKLLLAGQHGLTGDFYLPDGMTAEHAVRHVQIRCGAISPSTSAETPSCSTPSEFLPKKAPASFHEMRERSHLRRDPMTEYVGQPFRGALDQNDSRVVQAQKLRLALSQSVSRARELDINYVLRLYEGFGKSSAHFDAIVDEALYDAMDRNGTYQSFIAVACRSAQQAAEKAREYRERTGGISIVIQSLRHAYETACHEIGESPIPSVGFDNGSLDFFLSTIKRRQPFVWDRLETMRRALWMVDGKLAFDSGRVSLFMTHAMARVWHHARNSRIWLHPDYAPSMSDEEAEVLRTGFTLSKVVFDEIEVDEFIHLLSEGLHDVIAREQERHGNWRQLGRSERLNLFMRLKSANAIPGKPVSFEEFESLMRLNLSELEPVSVDFDAMPFGHDNRASGLYNGQHKNRFYIGAQSWFSETRTNWGFLTTEALTTKLVEEVHRRNGRQLLSFSLPGVPGIHPVKVPVVLDPRAGKAKVSLLAQEIVQANPDAIVISDSVKGTERVMTFQTAKGYNGLEEKDIYIILTHLAPSKYEQSNVLGQWLGMPNILQVYYQDQINQAVGRNRGFRQSSQRQTRTVLIASKRLYDHFLSKFDALGSRVQMYLSDTKEW